MLLFLHIQITDHPEEIKFFNPIIPYIKEKNPAITIYDLDNHSDSLIIGYANKLITASETTIIYIDTMPESNFKNLMSLLTTLLDNPEGIQVIQKGDNPRLEKMLSILTHAKIPKNTPIIEVIEPIMKQFF